MHRQLFFGLRPTFNKFLSLEPSLMPCLDGVWEDRRTHTKKNGKICYNNKTNDVTLKNAFMVVKGRIEEVFGADNGQCIPESSTTKDSESVYINIKLH